MDDYIGAPYQLKEKKNPPAGLLAKFPQTKPCVVCVFGCVVERYRGSGIKWFLESEKENYKKNMNNKRDGRGLGRGGEGEISDVTYAPEVINMLIYGTQFRG